MTVIKRVITAQEREQVLQEQRELERYKEEIKRRLTHENKRPL